LYSFTSVAMPYGQLSAETQSPAVETFCWAKFPTCVAWNSSSAAEQVSHRDDGRLSCSCANTGIITIGRSGRPSQIIAAAARSAPQIETHWTNRGWLPVHCPGNLPFTLFYTSLARFLLASISAISGGLGRDMSELGVQISRRAVWRLGRRARSRWGGGPRLGYLQGPI